MWVWSWSRRLFFKWRRNTKAPVCEDLDARWRSPVGLKFAAIHNDVPHSPRVASLSKNFPKLKKFSQSFAIYNCCGYAQTPKFELTENVRVCLEPEGSINYSLSWRHFTELNYSLSWSHFTELHLWGRKTLLLRFIMFLARKKTRLGLNYLGSSVKYWHSDHQPSTVCTSLTL